MILYWKVGSNSVNKSFLDNVELGNVGYASSQCSSVDFGVGTISLQCPTGNIASVEGFGIIPEDAIF